MSHWDAIAEAERQAATVRRIPRTDPPSCPYCGRMMTRREKAEQGACNDCYEGRTA